MASISSARQRLFRSVAQNWQLETLLLALAGMEICWFTPLFLAFTRSAWAYPPAAVATVLWLLVWGMMRLARFLSERQIGTPLYELIVLGAVLLSSLMMIRLYVYWDVPWGDWSWLGSLGRSFRSILEGPWDEFIVLGTMFFLWWRAISLSQQDHTFQSVGYEFRRNVLLLIVSTLVLSYLVGQEINAFISPFFFCCLVAVALARVRDKSQVSGGIERPFGPRWLLILTAAGLLVLGLSWLLSGAYSVAGWRRLLGWMDPVFDLIGRALGWLVVKFLQLLGPVIEWLVALIQRLLAARLPEEPSESPLDELLQQMREGAGEYGGPPVWVMTLIRYVCPGLVVLVVLAGIVIWLERRRRWRPKLVEDESESLWQDRHGQSEAGGLLRQAWDRLRNLVAQAGRFGVGRRLYAAISVRYIYANVLRLAERRGTLRPVARTPREFLPTLARAFPGHEEDIARITEAYINVHYGEIPADRSELDGLRACWQRVRLAPAPDGDQSAE